MPWKTMDVHEQRVRFVVAASLATKPFRQLCEEFGVSRPTGYEWNERYEEDGLKGIVERSRRPLRSPRQTSSELVGRVIELRRRYPDWGARKLRVLLSREGLQLGYSTIHRILLRHDLVRDQDRRDVATQRFEREQPNELWQMDFKGPKQWNQAVGPLSVLDDHSRYLVVLQANGSTRGELVREQLESAFERCGVPEGMLMDHGIPWWGSRAPLGLTQLSLWLMKQGIRLHWSGIRHPQTQGKVERFHGELQRALERRGMATGDAQTWLDTFRWEHNYVRPHEALGMRTPSELWHPSPRPYEPNPRRWQYPEGARVLKVDSWGKLHWGGRKWNLSSALCGERVQIVEIDQRAQVYYCATLIRELDLGSQRSTIVERWLPEQVPKPKL
jgi:transposase InsO family protein